MQEKSYTIAGKAYIQRPLVLGQIKQLLGLMRDVSKSLSGDPVDPERILADISSLDAAESVFAENKLRERKDTLALIGTLGDNLPRAMAIVLIPQGQTARDRNLDEIENDLYECPPDTALEVILDFLSFSRDLSVIKQIKGNLKKTGSRTRSATSSESSTSSPRGMS